jgi:hypothetical protein
LTGELEAFLNLATTRPSCKCVMILLVW